MKKFALFLLFLCIGITVFAQNKAYKAGEIFSLTSYQYGKVEFRMRAAKASGVISNFFFYKNGSEQADVFWEEIDIEVFGKQGSNSWQSNLITGGIGEPILRSEGIHTEVSGLADEYHTYTLEWKPNSVLWKIDGITVRTQDDDLENQAKDINSPASLRFNFWNPNIPEWVGPFSENDLPLQMFVNWMKFYPYQNGAFSSTPQWVENFNTFDDSQWGKANWTFTENQSDFVPENVVVKNGYLVLSITNAGETGYTGTPPLDNGTIDENTSPVANFTASISQGTAPLEITFDSSSSFDNDGDALTYSWDFGDGTTSTSPNPTKLYTTPDSYQVFLVVNDGMVNSIAATTTIIVKPSGGSDCDFNTPTSAPLPTTNNYYTKNQILGSVGANFDNISGFSLNWDLANNGLWQIAIQTSNGQPAYYIDLKPKTLHTLGNAAPSITFTNTGIPNLDDTYYVTKDGDNLVLVSTRRNFSIYFSNSSAIPNCNSKNNDSLSKSTLKIYPNPASDYVSIKSSSNKTSNFIISNLNGKEVLNVISNKNNVEFNVKSLPSDIYLVQEYRDERLISVKKLIID